MASQEMVLFDPTTQFRQNIVKGVLYTMHHKITYEITPCNESIFRKYRFENGHFVAVSYAKLSFVIEDVSAVFYNEKHLIVNGKPTSNLYTYVLLFADFSSNTNCVEFQHFCESTFNLSPSWFYQNMVMNTNTVLYIIAISSTFHDVDMSVIKLDVFQKTFLFLGSQQIIMPLTQVHAKPKVILYLDLIILFMYSSTISTTCTNITLTSFKKVYIFELTTKEWHYPETKPDPRTNRYPADRANYEWLHKGNQKDCVYVIGGTNGQETFKDYWCLDLDCLIWYEVSPKNHPDLNIQPFLAEIATSSMVAVARRAERPKKAAGTAVTARAAWAVGAAATAGASATAGIPATAGVPATAGAAATAGVPVTARAARAAVTAGVPATAGAAATAGVPATAGAAVTAGASATTGAAVTAGDAVRVETTKTMVSMMMPKKTTTLVPPSSVQFIETLNDFTLNMPVMDSNNIYNPQRLPGQSQLRRPNAAESSADGIHPNDKRMKFDENRSGPSNLPPKKNYKNQN